MRKHDISMEKDMSDEGTVVELDLLNLLNILILRSYSVDTIGEVSVQYFIRLIFV